MRERRASHAIAAAVAPLAVRSVPRTFGSGSRILVGPFVYLRLHGPRRYGGRYPDELLGDWADWLAAARASSASPLDAYVYFNNDVGGHAPRA